MGAVQSMERRKEVESALKKENVDILVQETKNGKINIDQLKMIAIEMGGAVHGVFTSKLRANIEPLYILLHMLDSWYNEELYDTEFDGVSRLIEILKDENVGLKAAAHRIQQGSGAVLFLFQFWTLT